MASGVVRPPFEPSPRRYGLQVPARMSYAWHKTTEALPGGTHDQRDHGAGAGDLVWAIVIYGSTYFGPRTH